MSNMTELVLAENVVKRYGSYELKMSIRIKTGCVTGLVGKNGAGKSTTIKMILGLVAPSEGKITVFGKSASELTSEDKQNIGVALAESGFSQYLCVKDAIAIMKKMFHEFDENEFKKNCSEFSIPLDKPMKEFSTGMKAKVRVLVALSHKAKLLILDEPTAGLDVEARNEILDMFRNYLVENEDCSILITSHISSDLEGICDDIYLLHDGSIILHEETDKLLSEYAILKMDEKQYDSLDKQYILNFKKDKFGYTCFTNEKQFYIENYPDIVVENGGIDDLILMMAGKK